MFKDLMQKMAPASMWSHFLKRIRTIKGILVTVVFAAIGIYLLTRWREFGRGANDGKSFWMFCFLGIVALGVFTYIRFMAVASQEAKKCISIPGALAAGVLFAAVWHYSVELIVNSRWRKISSEHVLMDMAICGLMFFFLFFLLHSLKAAVVAGSLFYFLFALAEYYTIEFRGIPVMFYDLLDVGAAAEVAGNYDFDITKGMIVVFLLLFFLCLNVLMQGDRVPGMTLRAKLLSRVAAVAIAVITVFGIAHSASFSKSVGRVGTPKRDFYNVGSQLCFIQTIKNAHIAAPAGYSVSALKELAAPYTEKAASESTGLPDGTQPNIIAIMDEAFADVEISGPAALAADVMPNYMALKENAIKGKVMVSTYGGGTGRSEFEFNTGGSMHLFSPNASPYAMFGQRMNYALASQMKSQGYHTIAIHPYSRTNYNRERTYAAMGFDEFLAQESFKKVEKIRSYVSDRATFERICDLTEETEEPLFTFCVTMQNHGGYKDKKYEASYIYGDGSFPQASQYLSLVKTSDEALGEMIERLSKSDEKTILVFFGDHFPSLSDTFYEAVNGVTKDDAEFETAQLYYQTPFLIWANYDIPEEEDTITSLNYLGLRTVQLAGAKLTGFQEYLLDLKEEVPAFSGYSWYGKDGRYHEHGSDAEVEELLNQYDALEYNLLIDKKNTLADFFSAAGENQ